MNRLDAILGSKVTFIQIKRMYLNMYVGIGDEQSKTEAMFFFQQKKISKSR